MYDRVTVLDIIDKAFDERRFCEVCGAPTVLQNRGDTVVLECSARAPDAGVLSRIGAFLVPHTQRVVIDLAEEIAA